MCLFQVDVLIKDYVDVVFDVILNDLLGVVMRVISQPWSSIIDAICEMARTKQSDVKL